ncbi:MAG: hypothetical protein QXU17_00170 [Archaeoglobaceae archaeon]
MRNSISKISSENTALEPRYISKAKYDIKSYAFMGLVFFLIMLILLALRFSTEFLSLISFLAGMIVTISSLSAYNFNETKKLARKVVQQLPAEEWALAKPYAVIKLKGDIYLIVALKQFFGNYLRIYAIKPLFAFASSEKLEFRLESEREVSKSKAVEPLQILEIKNARFKIPSTSSKELIIQGEGLIAFGSAFLGKEGFDLAKSCIEAVIKALKEVKLN